MDKELLAFDQNIALAELEEARAHLRVKEIQFERSQYLVAFATRTLADIKKETV